MTASTATEGTPLARPTLNDITRDEIEAFLNFEARLLDDRDFERWLELYREDAPFWMPAWDDDGELTRDPQTEISLIWYPDRSGLEDRVFRIRTDRSSATSLPEPRTGHALSGLELLEERSGEIDIRFNWTSHYFRYNTTDTYFGTSFYTLDVSGDSPLIASKKVVLKNDYIHHIIDVYMI